MCQYPRTHLTGERNPSWIDSASLTRDLSTRSPPHYTACPPCARDAQGAEEELYSSPQSLSLISARTFPRRDRTAKDRTAREDRTPKRESPWPLKQHVSRVETWHAHYAWLETVAADHVRGYRWTGVGLLLDSDVSYVYHPRPSPR